MRCIITIILIIFCNNLNAKLVSYESLKVEPLKWGDHKPFDYLNTNRIHSLNKENGDKCIVVYTTRCHNRSGEIYSFLKCEELVKIIEDN